MRLLVNLIYDNEYRGYVADVPELPGCMSQGKTIEEAIKNIKEAVGLYLECEPRRKHHSPKYTLTTTVEV